MKIKVAYLALAAVLLPYSFVYAQAAVTERLTLTTYYPSPAGSYGELSANRVKIGVNYSTQAVGDNNLIVEGNLGIGTATPQAQLDMANGGIRLGNVTRTTWPGIEIIGSDDGFAGQTGNAACAARNKQCVKVISYNFIKHDAGCPGATHCIHVCDTFYNTGLAGVAQGQDKDNIHNCSAILGEQTTYLHVNVVRCNAFFSAICE